MSETDQTTAVVEPTTAAGGNPLVLVASVVGAIAAAALVWFFLVSPLLLGDEAGANDPVAGPGPDGPPGEVEAGGPGPDPQLAADPEELPLVTFEVFLARDPFEPVIPEPISDGPSPDALEDDPQTITDGPGAPAPDDPDNSNGSDGTDNSNDTVGPTDPNGRADPTDPGATPAPGTGDDARQPSCRNGNETVCDGRTVSLIEVSSDTQGRMAVVQVDSTIYEVREGDVFAREFLVQSIGEDRVMLVFGDEVVTVRRGERVLK